MPRCQFLFVHLISEYVYACEAWLCLAPVCMDGTLALPYFISKQPQLSCIKDFKKLILIQPFIGCFLFLSIFHSYSAPPFFFFAIFCPFLILLWLSPLENWQWNLMRMTITEKLAKQTGYRWLWVFLPMLTPNSPCLQLVIRVFRCSGLPFSFQVKMTLFKMAPMIQRPSTGGEKVPNQKFGGYESVMNYLPSLCLFSYLENRIVEIDVF